MENKQLQQERKGYRSPKNGHLGVYTLCSGPDPRGPAPGPRLIIVIYNEKNEIVRRLEQIKGDTIQEGYVDFFLSNRCRPNISNYHIIDVDANGKIEIMATHTDPSSAGSWLQNNVPAWVQKHGVPQ